MSGQLDYEINKELGECYLFMGELDKAEEYYKKAVGSNGVHPDPYLGLATVAVQRGDLDSALVMYEKAQKIEPSDKSLSGIALIKMDGGDRESAFDLFVEALRINPENMVALFSLIRLGHEMDRVADVVPHLEDYLAIDPAKNEVRFSLAGCLVRLGQEDAAREHLEKILEMDPAFEAAKEMLDVLHA